MDEQINPHRGVITLVSEFKMRGKFKSKSNELDFFSSKSWQMSTCVGPIAMPDKNDE